MGHGTANHGSAERRLPRKQKPASTLPERSRARIDFKGQRIEHRAGRGEGLGRRKGEEPRRIAGPDGGAGRQHEFGQLRLLADAGGRREVSRIQAGSSQVDGRCGLGRRHVSIGRRNRGLVQESPHGVEWLELPRALRERRRDGRVEARQTQQGGRCETGADEATSRRRLGFWAREIVGLQPLDDPRPVREPAHPPDGLMLRHQRRQSGRHRGLPREVADQRRLSIVQCVDRGKEAIAWSRGELWTDGERARRTLLSRHRHVDVDERDLDPGL